MHLPADPRKLEAAPIKAMRFNSPLTFAKKAATESESDNTRSRGISLLARTNKVLDHWYWGRCIHDFAGMQLSKDRIALDWGHWSDELVGYADSFTVDESGLTLGGRIESIEDGDRAQKIIKQSDVGIPHEASIFFDDVSIEWIPEGFQTQVNGLSIEGPLCVFRKWLLRACSVVPYGYDSSSVSSIEEKPTQLQWTNPMTATAPTQTTPVTVTTDPRAELKQFMDKFGSDGPDYFQRGLNLSEAAAEHCTKLTARHETELTALKASHTETITKLTAERDTAISQRDAATARLEAAKLSIGEPTGIDVGKPGDNADGTKTKTFAQMIRPK